MCWKSVQKNFYKKSGVGQTDKSSKYLDEVIALDVNHQGIQAFRSLIDAKL